MPDEIVITDMKFGDWVWFSSQMLIYNHHTLFIPVDSKGFSAESGEFTVKINYFTPGHYFISEHGIAWGYVQYNKHENLAENPAFIELVRIPAAARY